jgi:hypothetical protein
MTASIDSDEARRTAANIVKLPDLLINKLAEQDAAND